MFVAGAPKLLQVLKDIADDEQAHQAEKADEKHPPELPEKVAMEDGHGMWVRLSSLTVRRESLTYGFRSNNPSSTSIPSRIVLRVEFFRI